MADITSNLVVYYTFNNGYLNFANGYPGVADTSNNGTTISNTTYKVGNGSLSVGTSKYLQILTSAVNTSTFYTAGNGLSFSFWIYFSSASGGATIFNISKSTAQGSSQGGLGLQIQYSSGKWYVYYYGINTGLYTPFTFSTNTWTHLVWTMNKSNSVWTTYQNGVQNLAPTTIVYPPSSDVGTTFINGGGSVDTPNSGPFWTGYLDDFRIYQRVLSQADVTALYNYTGSDPPPPPWSIPCFREGTQILCFHDGKEQYLPVEKLRTGTLVKTPLAGFLPIDLIGRKKLQNPSHRQRIENRLYRCSKENYPQLFEDLYITGHHSILVDKLTEEQKEKTIKIMKRVFITDDKYRLLACIDERAEPFAEVGEYMIYHFALENDVYHWNYGVYANGLLVESCSKEYLENKSGMEII
jgi:hypothetical protein